MKIKYKLTLNDDPILVIDWLDNGNESWYRKSEKQWFSWGDFGIDPVSQEGNEKLERIWCEDGN